MYNTLFSFSAAYLYDLYSYWKTLYATNIAQCYLGTCIKMCNSTFILRNILGNISIFSLSHLVLVLKITHSLRNDKLSNNEYKGTFDKYVTQNLFLPVYRLCVTLLYEQNRNRSVSYQLLDRFKIRTESFQPKRYLSYLYASFIFHRCT